MRKTIESAIKYQDLHSQFPEIGNYLRIEDQHERLLERARKGELDKATVDRSWEDGTFERMMAEHTIMCGSFQTVASQLIGQRTQQRTGERELHDGIRSWMRIRDERREKDRLAALATRATGRTKTPKKRKLCPRKPPDDVVL